MSARLDVSGTYARYQGRTLRQAFTGPGWIAVDDDGGAFPDAAERGRHPQTGPWVKLPRAALERVFTREVTATWDGGRVFVVGVDGDRVAIRHFEDEAWARAHDLQGSRYEGFWFGEAPAAELEDVTVAESEAS